MEQVSAPGKYAPSFRRASVTASDVAEHAVPLRRQCQQLNGLAVCVLRFDIGAVAHVRRLRDARAAAASVRLRSGSFSQCATQRD